MGTHRDDVRLTTSRMGWDEMKGRGTKNKTKMAMLIHFLWENQRNHGRIWWFRSIFCGKIRGIMEDSDGEVPMRNRSDKWSCYLFYSMAGLQRSTCCLAYPQVSVRKIRDHKTKWRCKQPMHYSAWKPVKYHQTSMLFPALHFHLLYWRCPHQPRLMQPKFGSDPTLVERLKVAVLIDSLPHTASAHGCFGVKMGREILVSSKCHNLVFCFVR